MLQGLPIDQHIRLPLCDRSSAMEDLYSMLFAIRKFEQSILEMFDKGLLAGTTHTCIGQESTAVGILSSLNRERDVVFSNHRCHGHFLAYSGEIERLYLELMGDPKGICGGRGGSQHLHYNNFYSNGIQGGIVPVATGMALAEKLGNSDAIITVFLGDGTLGEGAVYEAFNIASLWQLPVLFVIDNNGYSQSTPYQHQIAGSVKARPEAFGIPVTEQTTTDVLEVFSLAVRSVDDVRSERRPHCLLLHTYRLGPHSKGDDDRDASEIEVAWRNDPLKLARQHLGDDSADRLEIAALTLVTQAKDSALAAVQAR